MDDMLLVKSRVKEYIREHGCSPTQDSLDQLNRRVKNLIKKTTERTKGNGRKRVKKVDV